MIIHIVQSGDTIDTIAEQYNISAAKIIIDNEIPEPYTLVQGQSIVIVYPEQSYIVQEGDTLESIASSNNISVRQLLRNNPYLLDRDIIIPGEMLTISYPNTKGKIAINAFAYVFISKELLRKTLPYLTYLTIMNYQFSENYEITGEDDSEILRMTKEAGVIPLLQITTFQTQSIETIEATLRILYSEEIQDLLIEKTLNLLKSRGYYGINVTFSYIDSQNYTLYNHYLSKISARLNSEGLFVFVTLAPRENLNINEVTFMRSDFTEIGQLAHGINLLDFDWSSSFEPPTLQTTTYIGNEFINYAKTMIPVEKTYIGLSSIAYDWQLPYELGVTKANSMSTNTAIELARDTGSVISYDDIAEAAYFQYYHNKLGVPLAHLVWFRDARSVDTRANQVIENGFAGLSVWNIMYYFAQLWLVINSQYEIEIVTEDLS